MRGQPRQEMAGCPFYFELIPEEMNIEKTIQICGKDVIMRYCAGAETGYEILADGKSSEVFAPTVAEYDENGKPVKLFTWKKTNLVGKTARQKAKERAEKGERLPD